MRILYFSDIHIEIRESEARIPWTVRYPLDLGPCLDGFKGEVDLVILAGDVGTAREVRGVSSLGYARQVSEFLGCPVVLVPGNHEYYGSVFEDAREDMLSDDVPGVHVLDRGEAAFEMSGVRLRVLGATLWTDYAVAGDFREAMEDAARHLNDHRRIMRRAGGTWQPQDALREHMRSREWLLERLAEPHDGPTLVVTHHVPHPSARNEDYPFDIESAAFMSDCWDVIREAKAAGAVGWIFGHNHFNAEVEVGGLPLLSAQWGYPHEGKMSTRWNGPQILEVEQIAADSPVA